MKLQLITFTGIDERTDLERLKEVSDQFDCEWGILFSSDRQGEDPRYPARKVIDRALATDLRFAAHLCGTHAQKVNNGEALDLDLAGFTRVQVNHRKPNTEVLQQFSTDVGIPVIAQWRHPEGFPAQDAGVSWLFDTSGGNGARPSKWPINPSLKAVGYAGGINPDNAAEIVRHLEDLPSLAGYWIDMETGVRSDNWLDLDRVQAVIDAARQSAS